MLTGSASGTIYFDRDVDGTFDPNEGERPLADQTVYVDQNNNGQWDVAEPRAVTDASGRYHFTDLPVGRIRISHLTPAGWRQTAPLGSPNVLATHGHEILEYTREGYKVRSIGVPSPVPRSVHWKLRDLAVDQQGRIHVLQGDFTEGYISTYDPATASWQHHTRNGLVAYGSSDEIEISIGGDYLYVGLFRFNVVDWTSHFFPYPTTLRRGLSDVSYTRKLWMS